MVKCARWDDCGEEVALGLVDGESSSESLILIMLACFLCPFVAPPLGVVGGVDGDEDSEVTADVAGAASSGTLHGFLILSVFCHLQHCHIAGAGQRLQAESGPFLLGGALASAVPGLEKSAFE